MGITPVGGHTPLRLVALVRLLCLHLWVPFSPTVQPGNCQWVCPRQPPLIFITLQLNLETNEGKQVNREGKRWNLLVNL